MQKHPNEKFKWKGKTYDLRISMEPSGYKVKTYLGEKRLASYAVDYETSADSFQQHKIRGLEMLKELAKGDIKNGLLRE